MRRISFAQRFIAYLCCLSLNVPVLAQAHTIGPNGPIPVERAPLPLPAPERAPASLPDSRPVPPPVTKPLDTPMPAPEHSPVESETAGRRKKEIYYIHTDHLNTPRSITNGEQKKVWKWGNVDPFGKNAADENPEGRGRFAFNLRFPGQYYDRETGLHYNWHRDYNPGIGRYVQSDPIGLIGGLNTYGYVGGSPLVYSDHNGQFFGLITGVLFAMHGGYEAGKQSALAMCKIKQKFNDRKLDPNWTQSQDIAENFAVFGLLAAMSGPIFFKMLIKFVIAASLSAIPAIGGVGMIGPILSGVAGALGFYKGYIDIDCDCINETQ